MTVEFTLPKPLTGALHHDRAAAGNAAAATRAIKVLSDCLSGTNSYDKVLLRAAAGAGKSVQLLRMVVDALAHPACVRVAVTAFQNRQVWPLAENLGSRLGQAKVCLLSGKDAYAEVPDDVLAAATVVTSTAQIPPDACVVLGTASRLGAPGEYGRQLQYLGPAGNNEKPFDVLFVDEAWQMALHLFSGVERYAPIIVGVGDVGQLPPIDVSDNPWRGDPGYNPYRAWPTAFSHRETTFSIDLPAVWRPHGNQLALWRAFYGDWDRLDCVAAPDDRSVQVPELAEPAHSIWSTVASGLPTLVELGGLPEPDAPDIDRPLLDTLERLLAPLLEGGIVLHRKTYKDNGRPKTSEHVKSSAPTGDPLVVILATRNAAVDYALEVVDRLVEQFNLPEGVLTASTVDRWQGQTNGITVAVHPLSGADALDEFNSAFGRLAVACTRATHGLLLLARSGLDELLQEAPARPGTPLGEPGTRSLPRQTHQRILACFARGRLSTDIEPALSGRTGKKSQRS